MGTPISLFHIPYIAIAAAASDIHQNDVGSSFGPYSSGHQGLNKRLDSVSKRLIQSISISCIYVYMSTVASKKLEHACNLDVG